MSTGVAQRAIASAPVDSFVHTNRLPGTPDAAASAVKRARQRGVLVRIRQGLSWKCVTTRYGTTYPSAEEIAFEVLGRNGVGTTGWSAAREFGLTTQVPPVAAMVVAGPVPTALPGVKISRRNNLKRLALNPTEVAAMELLRGEWTTVVDEGWPALVDALGQAVESGAVRWSELVTAARGERSPALRDTMRRLSDDLVNSGILA